MAGAGTTHPGAEEARKAVIESAAWRLLELLLERPDPERRHEIEGRLQDVDEPELVDTAYTALKATEDLYQRSLGAAGCVPAREAAYSRREPRLILSELTRLYEGAGYRPAPDEPPDHVAVEAGFVGHLHLGLAFALEQDDREAVRTTHQTLAHFLEVHLGSFIGELARGLRESGAPYLARSARLLAERVAAGRAAAGVGGRPE